MLVPIDRLVGMPVMSLQTGVELARIGQPIVDPRQLTVAAFWVEGRLLADPHSVLHPEDIREISDIGCVVDSSDALMPTEGLVRLQRVIDFNFTLPGLRVEDELGHKLGTVSTYAVDLASLFIQQLSVKPTLMKSLHTATLTVHRTQVLKVKHEKIIVKAATTHDEAPQPAVRHEFVNPFRTPVPTQPDTSQVLRS